MPEKRAQHLPVPFPTSGTCWPWDWTSASFSPKQKTHLCTPCTTALPALSPAKNMNVKLYFGKSFTQRLCVVWLWGYLYSWLQKASSCLKDHESTQDRALCSASTQASPRCAHHLPSFMQEETIKNEKKNAIWINICLQFQSKLPTIKLQEASPRVRVPWLSIIDAVWTDTPWIPFYRNTFSLGTINTSFSLSPMNYTDVQLSFV